MLKIFFCAYKKVYVNSANNICLLLTLRGNGKNKSPD